MARVFISYRREEEPFAAYLLYEALVSRYGRSSVFLDAKDIPPGDVFEPRIRNAIRRCDAVVVVIGKKWRDAVCSGTLYPDYKFVGMEICEALDSKKAIIPIAVDMTMGRLAPSTDRWVQALQQLNAVDLRPIDYSRCVDLLIAKLNEEMPSPPRPQMIRLPAGSFELGTNDGDNREGPSVNATVSRPFKLAEATMTRRECELILGPREFASNDEPDGACVGDESEENGMLPATEITWLEAVQICNEMSRLHGLKEYYLIREGRVSIADGIYAPGYRLPTEAESEYACRLAYNGIAIDVHQELQRYAHTDADKAKIATRCRIDSLGFHALLGNVWEWCWDRYDPEAYETYNRRRKGKPMDDPVCDHDYDGSRVIRGGSFRVKGSDLRPWTRAAWNATDMSDDIGVRVAQSCEC